MTESPFYNSSFYAENKKSNISANVISSLLYKFFKPKSVVDVGCGSGAWSCAFKKLGCDIVGIDGEYVRQEDLLIDRKTDFYEHDLEERLILDRKFDLAISLEVAEHLTPDRADSFVEDLTKLSDIVVFSAALPGQGGTNHINEQPHSYWVKKFSRFGYLPYDIIRPNICSNNGIELCYASNILVFSKKNVYDINFINYDDLQLFYFTKHPSRGVGLFERIGLRLDKNNHIFACKKLLCSMLHK